MTKQSQYLAISPKRFEAFLTSLVNFHWQEPAPILDDRDFNRFMEKFAAEFGLYDSRFLRAFFGENVTKEQALGMASTLIPNRTSFETGALRFLCLLFRAAWVESDPKVRQWAWVRLRSKLARSFYSAEPMPWKWIEGRVKLSEPPAELPVEQAFSYLLRHHGRTRICPNAECPTAYFLATRHTQRYCSPSCAQNGERETKRRWWAEHGEAWRKTKTRKTKTLRVKTNSKTTKQLRKGK
jgi:hypothetical protein